VGLHLLIIFAKINFMRKDPLRHVGYKKINQEILSFLGYRSRGKSQAPFYQVRCNNCSNLYESTYYNIADPRKVGVSCRKCSNNIHRNYERLTASEAQLSIVYSNYKSRAKLRNREFNLSKEEFEQFVRSNCHYCNQKPNRIRLDRIKGRRVQSISHLLNGIDRKDSDLGYTKENSLPCCEDCNKGKRNLSYKSFLGLVKSIQLNLKL
jgi:hypothetical protein